MSFCIFGYRIRPVAICIISFLPVLAFAQVLNQDRNGRTTIFYQGTNLSFDLGQPTASFLINNLEKRLTQRQGWAYQVNIQAKNEEGTGALLKSGNFVPSGILMFREGFFWTGNAGRQHLVFVEGEIRATSFYTFTPDSTKALDTWFLKRQFNAWRYGIFYNLNIDRWILGAAFGYQAANNLNDLSTDDYTFRADYKINNQTVSRTFSRSAYPDGMYKSYHSNYLNFDVIRTYTFDSSTTCFWNMLFVRSEFNAPRDVCGRLDAGTGVTFVNSDAKVVGGLYLQWDDVTNSRTNAKSSLENLFLGIITKFPIN